MNDAGHAKSARLNTEISVKVLQNRYKIPATIIDIDQRKISLLSQERILPGLRVKIELGQIDNYTIGGTVQWALLVNENEEFQYRAAIKVDEVLTPDDIQTITPFR